MPENRSYLQRRLSRRRVLRGAAFSGVGLAAAALISCAEEKKLKAAPAAAPGAAGQPKRGGTISDNVPFGEAPHQDIHQSASLFFTGEGGGAAYSRLFRWKLEQGVYPNEVVPEGDLAERWEQPDPQTLIVRLFRGVKWHNIPPLNGRELVAEDVVFSYTRQRAERVNASLLESISRITAVDSHTVRLDLTKPEADILLILTDMRNKIVSPEAVKVRGDLKEGPTIGTGPWIFKEWQKEQLVRMERNPEYFRQGLPHADAVQMFRIRDPQTQQAAFRTGQVHALVRVNKQIIDLLKRDVPNLQVTDGKVVGPQSGFKIWMHNDRRPTSDIRVRQAIAKAVDREAFIRTIVFGSAWMNAGVFVPSLDWHLPEAEVKRLLEQNLTEARQLLAAAGVDAATWRPAVKTLSPPAEYSQGGELLAAQLRSNLGINAQLVIVDNLRILNEVWIRGEFEMAVSGGQPQAASATEFLRRWHQTGGTLNGGKINDVRLDEMIDRQATMVGDREGRKRLLQDIQRRVIELAGITNVYSRNEETAVSPSLKNFFYSFLGDDSRWERAWLEG